MTNTQREWEGELDDIFNSSGFDHHLSCYCGWTTDECKCPQPRQKFKELIARIEDKARAEGAAAERERAAAIVENMMEDHEHWRPIAQRILTPTKDKGEDVSSKQ